MNLPAPEPGLPPRLTMRAFWRELGDGVLNFERGLPWTFWRLLRAPGALIHDYVVRRDARIVRPEFAEMWVFCLYVAGQAMLLIALLAVLEGLSGWPVFGYAALATAPALYVAACIGYFRTPLPGRLLRALLALTLGAVLTLLFFTACLFAAMATFRQIA